MCTDELSMDSLTRLQDFMWEEPVISSGQYDITICSSVDYAYYGFIFVTDTESKTTRRLVIPIVNSYNIQKDSSFFNIENNTWWFVVKTGHTWNGSLLAMPTLEDDIKGIRYQYKFTSKDFGETWEILRLEDVNIKTEPNKK